jgi:hypothetical protein
LRRLRGNRIGFRGQHHDDDLGSGVCTGAGHRLGVQANSRLSCQIEVTPELDGLVLRLPESQT